MLVPCFVGGYDGTMELCYSSDVDTAPAIYSCLLWIHCAHSIFQPWSKCSFALGELCHDANFVVAWKQCIDNDIVLNTTGVPDMVSCQLFPDG